VRCRGTCGMWGQVLNLRGEGARPPARVQQQRPQPVEPDRAWVMFGKRAASALAPASRRADRRACLRPACPYAADQGGEDPPANRDRAAQQAPRSFSRGQEPVTQRPSAVGRTGAEQTVVLRKSTNRT